MALALTILRQETSGNAFGAGTFSPTAFTPTAGRRLLVLAQMTVQSDDGTEGTALTITDNDSSITSWTVAATGPNAPAGWSYGSRAWISDQGASGSSMQVTLDCGAAAVENYRVTVWEVTDYGAIGATATGTDADGDGAVALTLSASPLSTSICIAAVNVSLSGGASAVTPNAAWTEVEDNSRANWWTFQIQSRASSTSTAVDWDDINTAGSVALGAIAFAFEVKAAAAPTINTQPQSQTVYQGQTATFTISATTSGGTLHYQWKDDGSNVGTDSDTYAPTPAYSDSGSIITCVVSDDNGSTTSADAVLTVLVAASLAWYKA